MTARSIGPPVRQRHASKNDKHSCHRDWAHWKEMLMRIYLAAAILLTSAFVFCQFEAWAQSAGGACTSAQNGQSFVTSGPPTQFLMCNGSNWVLAKEMVTTGSVGIAWGSSAPTPQAALDVNGGVRVKSDTNCTSSNNGEIIYTTSSTICGSGVSSCLAYCNSSNNWVSFGASSSPGIGCPQTGTFAGAQTQILTVNAGCRTYFQVWGAGGGAAATTATGGAGGYVGIVVPSSTSAVTYYLAIGGGGAATNTASSGSGGVGVYGYNGAAGKTYTAYGGGGGGASGVWTLGFGGYSVGSASQSTTTVTGTGGTSWTSSMIGSTFSYTNGVSVGTVTGVTTGSSLTVSISSTVASQAYTIGVVAVAAGGAGGDTASSTSNGTPGGDCTNSTGTPVTEGSAAAGSFNLAGGGAGYPTGGDGTGGQNYPYSGSAVGITTTPPNQVTLTALGTGQYSGYATGGSSGANGTDGVITWQTY